MMRPPIAFVLLLLACAPSSPRRAHGVVVSHDGHAKARVIVTTVGSVIKETGPAAAVAQFGEVYAFQPAVFAVRRDEPTEITFWNLQADDEHDFMLTDTKNQVITKTKLPPLSKTKFVMTFHDEGIYPFYCVMHQPAMSGQIIVNP